MGKTETYGMRSLLTNIFPVRAVRVGLNLPPCPGVLLRKELLELWTDITRAVHLAEHVRIVLVNRLSRQIALQKSSSEGLIIIRKPGRGLNRELGEVADVLGGRGILCLGHGDRRGTCVEAILNGGANFRRVPVPKERQKHLGLRHNQAKSQEHTGLSQHGARTPELEMYFLLQRASSPGGTNHRASICAYLDTNYCFKCSSIQKTFRTGNNS